MKLKSIFFCVLLVLVMINSCNNKRVNSVSSQICLINVEDIEEKLLGKRLDLAINFNDCFIVKDTVFESDAIWKGKSFAKNNKICFLAEATWLDSTIINRITIESSIISTHSGISVGSILGDIEIQLNDTIPNMPDGYFALRDKANPNIMYYFDVDKYTEVSEGRISSISKLPKKMKVSSIVLQKRK